MGRCFVLNLVTRIGDGGPDDDTLYSESGNDEMNVEKEWDQLFGGPDDNVLYGSLIK